MRHAFLLRPLLLGVVALAAFGVAAPAVYAQAESVEVGILPPPPKFSQEVIGTVLEQSKPKQDLTRPEEDPQADAIAALFAERPIEHISPINAFAYWVRYAVDLGIPANTILLLLLMPVIATLVTFVRVVVGLPSLEMLVPIVLAYAFVAVGVVTGLIILGAVVLASFVSRTALRRVPIMIFPKRSISHLFLAVFVFAALTLAIYFDVGNVEQLSIFPVLILALLGDSIVSVQLRKTVRETLVITTVTILLGLVGYVLATSIYVRDLLLVWPEVILLTLIINFAVGRYFGLRLLEVFRFRALESYGGK